MSKPRKPRYSVSLADDGAFLVRDTRHALHITRFYPAEFVQGCMSYDERTARFPDYVHAQLWALHDARSRRQLAESQAASAARLAPLFDELRELQTTSALLGLHVTLSGSSVQHDIALIEDISL